MRAQAVAAGVNMGALNAAQRQVSNPILHDESIVAPWTTLDLGKTDRQFNYLYSRTTAQKQAQLQGMTFQDSAQYIARYGQAQNNVVGQVNMGSYRQWLQANLNLSIQ
jgi:hypothetical protein